jgi:hypothetical protein
MNLNTIYPCRGRQGQQNKTKQTSSLLKEGDDGVVKLQGLSWVPTSDSIGIPINITTLLPTLPSTLCNSSFQRVHSPTMSMGVVEDGNPKSGC